jgi:hypothetical protein
MFAKLGESETPAARSSVERARRREQVTFVSYTVRQGHYESTELLIEFASAIPRRICIILTVLVS